MPAEGAPSCSWACGWCGRQRRRKRAVRGGTGDDDDDDGAGASSLFIDLPVLEAATAGFSDGNLLVRGGFGPVYKGVLASGEEVAGVAAGGAGVPQRGAPAPQGAAPQPRLPPRMLRRLWPQDAGLPVLPQRQPRPLPLRGYMAPEYAMKGYLSTKTDVFSFGMLVLEIVSGRKNIDRHLEAEKVYLLNYTWKLSEEGRQLEIVDPDLSGSDADEVALCVQLGLLCCQAIVSDRPDMYSVHLMLSSNSFTLPKPGKPGKMQMNGCMLESSALRPAFILPD